MIATFLAGVSIEKYIFFSNWISNGLYRLNIETGNCELVTLFLEEENSSHLHNYAFLCLNKIWFIPSAGKKIACYNIEKNSMKYIDLPKEGRVILDSRDSITFKFNCFYHVDSSICWMIPVGYNLLIKLDMINAKIEIIENWPTNLKWQDGITNFRNGYMLDNYIYLMPYDSTYGVKINLSDNQISKYSIEKCRLAIPHKMQIVFVSEFVGDKIKIYDYQSKKIREIKIEGEYNRKNYYLSYGFQKNKLILFPFIGQEEIHIDLDSMFAEAIPIIKENSNTEESWYFQRCLEINGVLYVISDRKNKIIKIYENGNREILEINIEQQEYDNVALKLFERNSKANFFSKMILTKIKEEYFQLTHYVKYVEDILEDKNEKKVQTSIGADILEEINVT